MTALKYKNNQAVCKNVHASVFRELFPAVYNAVSNELWDNVESRFWLFSEERLRTDINDYFYDKTYK